jgi:hypothetical protein
LLIVDCGINKTPTTLITLKFDYQSVWYQEMNKKELAGSITKVYKVVGQNIEFVEDQR